MHHDLPTRFGHTDEKPTVTRLEFSQAGVKIEGHFRLNEFATLDREHTDFLRLYLRSRGNLKEVERALGLSYPTVRARFEALLRSLGLEAPQESGKDAALAALERGELSVEDVLSRLEQG